MDDSHALDYLGKSQIHIIESWEEFQKSISHPKYRRWAFRGQEKSEWHLNTTLSRYFTDYHIHKNSWSHQEGRIIRIFGRKARLFFQHVPEADDVFEWLALMQHHGTPTRLLDFTWSPFVAAFFALEKAKTDCAVWAVNYSKLRELEHCFPFEQLPRKAPRPDKPVILDGRGEHDDRDELILLDNYRKYFLDNTVPFVTVGEPWNMSQRQIAQSGTFLVPGILDTPIEGILSGHPVPESILVKFVLKSDKLRDEGLESLYYMNITNATLFPGIDGMARSLAYELEFHWAFNTKTFEQYPDSMYPLFPDSR